MSIRSPLVGAALLSVILSAPPALAQQGTAASERHEVVVNGVTYRVPRAYRPEAPASPQAAERLSFPFWLSDLAPVKPGSLKRGTMTFWPPEPGRPSESADDFLVVVVAGSGKLLLDMLQATVRAVAREKPDREYGLDCSRAKIAPTQCTTEAGRDPVAHFTLVDTPVMISTVRTTAFSSKDDVYATIAFPMIGMPRWPFVLCQTYNLLRKWRVSGGPPPDDCSKLPSFPPR